MHQKKSGVCSGDRQYSVDRLLLKHYIIKEDASCTNNSKSAVGSVGCYCALVLFAQKCCAALLQVGAEHTIEIL